jgi:hypothetical protein
MGQNRCLGKDTCRRKMHPGAKSGFWCPLHVFKQKFILLSLHRIFFLICLKLGKK